MPFRDHNRKICPSQTSPGGEGNTPSHGPTPHTFRHFVPPIWTRVDATACFRCWWSLTLVYFI